MPTVARALRPGRRRLVSAPMPDLVDTIREEIDHRLGQLRPLAREASDLQRVIDALSGVTEAPVADSGGRRRSGQRASPPRSRSARRDIKSLVIEYVAVNPGSTASDVAKALGLKRSSVATRLTQLGKSGDLGRISAATRPHSRDRTRVYRVGAARPSRQDTRIMIPARFGLVIGDARPVGHNRASSRTAFRVSGGC
jgi:hypothetical protein